MFEYGIARSAQDHRSIPHRVPARVVSAMAGGALPLFPLLPPERLQIGVAHRDAEARGGPGGLFPEVGGTGDGDGPAVLLGPHPQGGLQRGGGRVVHLDPRTGIGEEEPSGSVPVLDPLAPSVHLSMERRQHRLPGRHILAFKAVAFFVSLSLFLVAEAPERCLGGGVPPRPASCSSQSRQTRRRGRRRVYLRSSVWRFCSTSRSRAAANAHRARVSIGGTPAAVCSAWKTARRVARRARRASRSRR